jgi:hypothetical protein
MKIFFNYIKLLPNGNLEEQCNLFATKGLEDHKWAFNNIIKFLIILKIIIIYYKIFITNPMLLYLYNYSYSAQMIINRII